jgi:hypothetical protein
MRLSPISHGYRSITLLQLTLVLAAFITFAPGSTRGAGTPALTLVSPNSATRGHASLDVEITGQDTHFGKKTLASFGPGITINSVTVLNSTFAVVNITVASTATLGAHIVHLSTSGESAFLTNGFTVTAVPTISITNATVIEGNSQLGPRAVFAATLSQASSLPVSVRYQTAEGTASSGGAVDFSADLTSIPSSGTATPYPSTTSVSAAAITGVVTQIIVGIADYGHTWPGDVDMLLQGPSGQTVLLMSDVGETGVPVEELLIRFDDSAPPMPAIPISGYFRPTNYAGLGEVSDSFPAPVPPGPYGNSLAVFNGLDPVGTWKLFVVDDNEGDAGDNFFWFMTIFTSTGDYADQAGTLTFEPGVTRMTFAVPIRGGTTAEANETFTATLSLPVNATIADATGTGTILNDDSGSPPAGSGAADMLLDLGASGVWGRFNNSTWTQIHATDASVVATADIDGNLQSDAIICFPGQGVWARLNGSAWKQVHWMDAIAIAAGDLDGNGQSDLVLNFGAAGVWAYSNNSTFFQINGGNPTSIVTGDLDGDGRAEVIMNFPQGIYQWNSAKGTTLIHGLPAASLAVGSLDGADGEELLIGFQGYGLYALRRGAWIFLHPLAPSRMLLADIDNNGQADLIANFTGSGVYSYKSIPGTWSLLRSQDADLLAAGDFDNNGRSDVLMVLPGSGLWALMNETSFLFVNGTAPQGTAVGKLD